MLIKFLDNWQNLLINVKDQKLLLSTLFEESVGIKDSVNVLIVIDIRVCQLAQHLVLVYLITCLNNYETLILCIEKYDKMNV